MEEINKLGEILKVEVNEGVTLRYLKAGKGAPLILLHTIRTQLDYFQEVIPTLATEKRPPLPPFTRETAIQKIRMAEDGWNSRDPQRVSLVYTPDSQWRNRAEFPKGREEIVEFLTRKWAKSTNTV